MKEKERRKNETEKKRSEKKKVPMWESNPRPLNLQPPHNYRLRDFVARTIIIIPTYTTNLNGDELRVASLAALAPPIIYAVFLFRDPPPPP